MQDRSGTVSPYLVAMACSFGQHLTGNWGVPVWFWAAVLQLLCTVSLYTVRMSTQSWSSSLPAQPHVKLGDWLGTLGSALVGIWLQSLQAPQASPGSGDGL